MRPAPEVRRAFVPPFEVLRRAFPVDRGLALGTAIVLAGKLVWLAVAGPTYEMDTATYLAQFITYHHPPLYGIFLHGLERVWANAHFVGFVQALIFALAAALACGRFGRSPKERVLLAVGLAVEPVTSFFCANLMSEALFAPLLLVWIALASQYLRESTPAGRRTAVALLAVVGALLSTIRLVAVILPGFFALAAFFDGFRIRRTLGHFALLLVLTEALLVPVKLVYLTRYGSYSTSLFWGVNLWNNACVLYPDSSVRAQPSTDFERFLATRPTDEFTTLNALHGNTIHEPWSGYQQFQGLHPMDLDQQRAFSEILGRTAWRLILEHPLRYVGRFVLPNYFKPLTISEVIPISPEVEESIRRRFGYVQAGPVRYRTATWWAWGGLMALSTALQTLPARRTREASLLLGWAWFYSLALPWLGASCLRYQLLAVPMILLGAWLTLVPQPEGPGRHDPQS